MAVTNQNYVHAYAETARSSSIAGYC